MERIDLFDSYFNGELSEEENIRFKERLEEDEQFASDFKVYSMTVAGIYKEAKQDNADLGAAMKHLSKDQLYEIIGRKPKSISREGIIDILQPYAGTDSAHINEISAAAALHDIDDDEYAENKEDVKTSKPVNDTKKGSGNSMRLFTVIFFAIVILLIIVSILL